MCSFLCFQYLHIENIDKYSAIAITTEKSQKSEGTGCVQGTGSVGQVFGARGQRRSINSSLLESEDNIVVIDWS